MTDASLLSAVSLPPREAIAFLRAKTNQTTQRWTDVWSEAHSRAFSVAGAASEALVQDFREAVTKAIEQGTTLAEFRRDFDTIVAKHGWVYNGSAAWRSQIIYETNLSTAYSAGRYVQMSDPDVLEAFPYWRYQHNAAIHPRQQHVDWSGLTLRADDPWWRTHYPPNGWRCHCSVTPVSEGGLRRMGRTAPDRAPPIDLQPVRIRTGDGWKTVQVPRGIDPGFGYNPGQAWQGRIQAGDHATLRAEAVSAPVHVAARPPGSPPRPPASVPDIARFLRAPRGEIPVGELHPDVAKAIGAEDREVRFSAETAEKQLEHHPDLTAAEYALIAQIAAEPAMAVVQSDHHVLLLHTAGKLYRLAIKSTRDGSAVYAVSLSRGRPQQVRAAIRRGRLIFGSAAAALRDEKERRADGASSKNPI